MKIGFFGKLPGYGDFVQRNVAPDIINQWDNWILQCIETSQMQLSETWKEVYFNSPIWRFTIDGRLLSSAAISHPTSIQHPISGVMMPSVDSAGRCYPFMIFCQAQRPVNLFTFANNIDSLHEKCEDFILSLLEQKRPNLDEIAKILQQMYAKFEENECTDVGMTNVKSSTELCRMSAPQLPAFFHSNHSFFSQLLSRQNMQLSLWTSAPSMHFDAQKRYYDRLPPVDIFSSFLIG